MNKILLTGFILLLIIPFTLANDKYTVKKIAFVKFEPHNRSYIYFVVDSTESFIVLKDTIDWLKIKLSKDETKIGWINKKYLRKENSEIEINQSTVLDTELLPGNEQILDTTFANDNNLKNDNSNGKLLIIIGILSSLVIVQLIFNIYKNKKKKNQGLKILDNQFFEKTKETESISIASINNLINNFSELSENYNGLKTIVDSNDIDLSISNYMEESFFVMEKMADTVKALSKQQEYLNEKIKWLEETNLR